MELLQKYFSDFTEVQAKQFAALKEIYTEWNEKINVISRKDMDNFYEHHVLHSLAIATQFDFKDGMQVIDLGCGGGFPGIPLAIFFPGTTFHMVDSINKKLKVVAEVAKLIGLSNTNTRHSRAEDIKDIQFDAVVSRAVAPLKDLLFWSKPLLKRAGPSIPRAKTNVRLASGLICLKGGDLSKEITESGRKPFVWEIEQIFTEDYFKGKYLLHIPQM